MNDPSFFPDPSGYLIHQQQLQEHGGKTGVRDPGLLSSAMFSPQSYWHYDRQNSDIATYAAAYAVRLAQDHPFNDGNKRTAAVVCETFLRDNGWALIASDDEWYDAMIRVASGELEVHDFAQWLRDRLVPRGS
jgi:death on curing protein